MSDHDRLNLDYGRPDPSRKQTSLGWTIFWVIVGMLIGISFLLAINAAIPVLD